MLAKVQDSSYMMPMLSIVTVVRNGRDHIEKTILSVLRQKNEKIEYIVIDGASSDGTVDILKKYAGDIDFWVTEQDSGIYDAMNKGILASKGKCIALLNCGDTYVENALQDVLEEISKLNSQYFVIAGGVHIIDQSGNEKEVLLVNNNSLNNKLKHMPLNHPAMFVSKTIYDDFGMYNTKLVICADYEFVLKILNQKIEITFVNKPLTKMLAGGISDSTKTIILKLKESYRVRRKYSSKFYSIVISIREVLYFLKENLNIVHWSSGR